MDAGISEPRRSTTGRRALLCLALAPFGAGFAAHLHARVGGATAQAAATPAATAPVVFDQYLVDLGAVKDTALVYAWYRFRNVSERPIRVRELHPSCGCLNPQLGKHDFAPGESGEFYLRVRTANEASGPHEYTVGFEYETVDAAGVSAVSTPLSETVTFRVTLPERKVTIEPKGLAFYQLDGNTTSREVVVRDFRPHRLRVLKATCASNSIAVEIGETTDEPGHRAQTIHVQVAGDVPAGTTHETIEIETDDETYPVLRFPVLLRGPEPPTTLPTGRRDVPPNSARNTNFELRTDSKPVGGDRPAP